ncbi:MAG: GNAT family N-acetyltransferase [Oligoflexia bacterium]|nr:GNAT family N-acetyltransferase [Oligoflexia bacterium]
MKCLSNTKKKWPMKNSTTAMTSTTAIDYKIVSLSSVNDNQRYTFYKKVFPGRASFITKHWKWLYGVERSGITPIVAIIGDQIIGHAGLMPVDLLSPQGDLFQAIWFTDFAVLPEYQKHGIGKNLTLKWMELCSSQVTLTCNDLSLRIFKKVGWDETCSAIRCALPIHPLRWSSLAKYFFWPKSLSPISLWLHLFIRDAAPVNVHLLKDDAGKFISLIADLEKSPKKNSEANVRISRNENWLEWRLLKYPFLEDLYFFEYNGCFSIVEKFYSHGICRAHILYLGGCERVSELKLYKSIILWSLKNNIDLVWLHTNDPDLPKELKSILPAQKAMRFASWSKDTCRREELMGGLIGLQAIDGDHSLTHDRDI